MLVGICGSVCAGKSAVEQFLVSQHDFKPLAIANPSPSSIPGAIATASDYQNLQSFATASDLLDHVTQDWTGHYVTTSIWTEDIVDTLSRRPLFVLLHIDAPLFRRFSRWEPRASNRTGPPSDVLQTSSLALHDFLIINDHNSQTLASLAARAQLKLYNTAPSLKSLARSLDSLNFTDPSRLRPTWDAYFMTLASLAARRSNCMRRQVGCVLIRSNRVLSTGYNGTPRHLKNCAEGGCARCNNPSAASGGAALSTCLCLHAEENALLEAGRERIEPGGGATGGLGGAVLYCNTCPCLTCSIKIVQVGIAEVVFSQSYYMDEAAAGIFREAGVKLRQFSPVKEGLVVLGGGEDEAASEANS